MADYDRPTVYRDRLVVARKAHVCEECNRLIEPGEQYQYAFMVQDGDPYTAATCSHCLVAQTWLRVNCGGWLFSMVREDIREHIHEYPTLARGLKRLDVGMKRQWRQFDSKGLMPVQPLPRSIASTVEEAV